MAKNKSGGKKKKGKRPRKTPMAGTKGGPQMGKLKKSDQRSAGTDQGQGEKSNARGTRTPLKRTKKTPTNVKKKTSWGGTLEEQKGDHNRGREKNNSWIRGKQIKGRADMRKE